MKKIFIISLVFTLSFGIKAQDDVKIAKNNFKLEGFGNAFLASVKYQRTLFIEDGYNLNFGVGATYIPLFEDYFDYYGPAFTLDLNFVIFNGNHHPVVGVGYAQFFLQSFYDEGTLSNSNLRLSYLYRKPTGGINASAGMVMLFPVKEMEDIIIFEESSYFLTFEVSVGYAF